MADIGRVKRNIQKMIDLGAPETDIDAYVAEEGLTAEQLRAAPAAAPQTNPQAAAAAEGRSLPSPGGYPAPPPKAEKTAGRAFMLGTQGIGRGIADVLGMPGDLSTGAANLALAGADKVAGLFGGGVDYRFPPSALGSEAISGTTGAMAEAAGLPLVEPQDSREKLSYNINRYGTQGLATAAGLMRAGAAMTPSAAPRLSDPFVKPYAEAPLKTVAGDAAAGAGSGVGLTTSQELLPQSVRDAGGGSVGTIADFLAMLAGGVGGGVTAATVADVPNATRSFLTAKRPAPVDFDPQTGASVTNRAFDKAAEKMQSRATDPGAAIQNIDAAIAESGGLPLPTTGLMSGDTGLVNLEQAMRTRQGGSSLAEGANVDPAVKSRYSFVERDTALRDAAVDEVNRLRPQGADPQAFPARAGEIVDMRLEQAQRPIDKAAGAARAVETAERPIADEFNANIGQGVAASRNIDDAYRQTRTAEQQRSATLYNDPAIAQAEVPVQPLRDTAEVVAGQGSPVAPLDPVVQKYTGRFAEMEGNATMADVNRLRAEIEADIKANLDNGAVVGQLRQFKDETARYAERLAAEGSPAGDAARAAAENFATRVQPNFREGAGGRVDATLKSNPNSPSALPSEMAGNFLTRPEDAQALMRIAELGGNRDAVAQNARTWLFDQIASKGIARDGAIDGEKLALWRNKNLALVDQISGLRQEIDGLVGDARRGTALKQDYAAQMAQAEQRAAGVRSETEGGILGKVRDKSPEKAAAAVFSSDNPEKAMTDLVASVGRNPAARDGLKAAIAEHFASKVSGVAPQNVSEGTQNINFAQLTKEFKASERVLSKLFSPEEMNSLQAAQKVLAPLAKRAQQAGVGSKTAEAGADYWRTFEAGAKLYFGMLKGGGITRTARLLASQFDDGSAQAAERLLARAMFDPKLAKQLLSAKVDGVPAPATNREVGKLLRKGEVGRQLSEEDDEEPSPLEVTVKPKRN
jgi:hypothetical protein